MKETFSLKSPEASYKQTDSWSLNRRSLSAPVKLFKRASHIELLITREFFFHFCKIHSLIILNKSKWWIYQHGMGRYQKLVAQLIRMLSLVSSNGFLFTANIQRITYKIWIKEKILLSLECLYYWWWSQKFQTKNIPQSHSCYQVCVIYND